jgi:hypothetical protein
MRGEQLIDCFFFQTSRFQQQQLVPVPTVTLERIDNLKAWDETTDGS